MKTLPFFLAVLSATSLCAIAADEKPAKPKRDPAQLFKSFDRNNDGGITLDEYKSGMGANLDPARVDGVFKKKDKDGDGKLNLEELQFVPPKATPAPAPKADAKPAATPEKKP